MDQMDRLILEEAGDGPRLVAKLPRAFTLADGRQDLVRDVQELQRQTRESSLEFNRRKLNPLNLTNRYGSWASLNISTDREDEELPPVSRPFDLFVTCRQARPTTKPHRECANRSPILVSGFHGSSRRGVVRPRVRIHAAISSSAHLVFMPRAGCKVCRGVAEHLGRNREVGVGGVVSPPVARAGRRLSTTPGRGRRSAAR